MFNVGLQMKYVPLVLFYMGKVNFTNFYCNDPKFSCR